MIIGSGAEAVIERSESIVRKTRPPKGYRHTDLDKALRQFRTRREAKVLSKLPIPGPALISVDDKAMVIEMEFLDGPQLRDVLSVGNAVQYGRSVGTMVRSLHDAGIIHGDLTTSNILVVDGKLHLIDFGLSFFSDNIEDKAVDLHLLMHAFAAKHPDIPVWDSVLAGYGDDGAVLGRLEEVEMRGRYKHKGS